MLFLFFHGNHVFIFIRMVKNLIETEKTCKLWLSTWIYSLVRHVIFSKFLHIWYFVNVLSNKQFWHLKLQNSMFAYEETISCLTRRTTILWNHNLMQLRRVIPLGYKLVWWNWNYKLIQLIRFTSLGNKLVWCNWYYSETKLNY